MMILEKIEKSKFINKFFAMNLWLIWLSWYIFTLFIDLLLGWFFLSHQYFFVVVEFGLIFGLVFATVATMMMAAIQISDTAWTKLTSLEAELDSIEDLITLNKFEIKLNEVAKDSTGHNYNCKIGQLKHIINLKRRYIH